jgi:prepilin-type processing-associated H-X9-DG protein
LEINTGTYMKHSAFKNTFGAGKVPRCEHAFTLTDLLAMMAIVALLAAMCLSALAKTHPNTQAMQCINNHQQLMRAFRMYADDNNDIMISCPDGGAFDPAGRPNYVPGSLSFSTFVGNWNPNVYITTSPLWPYLQTPAVYRCPSDLTVINVTAPPAGFNPGQYPRIRSISLNTAFGIGDWLPPSNWKLYTKYGAIDMPSRIFTFIDQHPNDINDANLAIQCDPPPTVVDRAGPYHDNGRASGISFADGHAEIHRWQGALIDPTIIPGYTGFLTPGTHPSSNPPDVADASWLASRTSVHQ